MKVSKGGCKSIWSGLTRTVLLFVYAEKIRVGRDYQAVCPELVAPVERKPETVNDRALLVWSPTKEITDTKRESQRRRGLAPVVVLYMGIVEREEKQARR